MTDKTEKMKALALAAGGEEWSIKENLPDYEVKMGNDFMLETAYYPVAPDVEKARFIAAANPAAVLELIAEVEKLRTELATRCRVEGGNTSENGGLLDDSKPPENRMGSSFEGGHLGSAPAAGTDKDAEQLVPRTDDFGTVWMVTPEKAAEIDAAIEVHTGK